MIATSPHPGFITVILFPLDIFCNASMIELGSLYVSRTILLFLDNISTQGEDVDLVIRFQSPSNAFVRFVLVWFCRFPLPLGVWEGLRFVIVAFHGLFSYLFSSPEPKAQGEVL